MCYSLKIQNLPYDKFRLLYGKLIRSYEAFFTNGMFFVWSTDENFPRNVKGVVGEDGKHMVVSEVPQPDPSSDDMNFVNTWIFNKYEEYKVEEFEEAHQEELQEMINNIEKIESEGR